MFLRSRDNHHQTLGVDKRAVSSNPQSPKTNHLLPPPVSTTTCKTPPWKHQQQPKCAFVPDSEPWLGKSKEPNNQGANLKVKRAFTTMPFSQKRK